MAGLRRKREGRREGKKVGGKEGLGNVVIARDDKQEVHMEGLTLRGLKNSIFQVGTLLTVKGSTLTN